MATKTMKLILVLLLCGLAQCVAERFIRGNKLKPLMSYLRNHGNITLIEENNKNKAMFKGPEKMFTPIKQYLVAAVVSRNELNTLPETLGEKLLKKHRMQVYLNKKLDGYGGGKFHGEMDFFHKGGLDTMVNRLRNETGSDIEPVVLLYSYYIPCAHVGNVQYSCSEEVGKAAYYSNYTMYVGFTEVFVGTDLDQALQYLSKGRFLKLYRDTTEAYEQLIYIPPDYSKPTFQKQFSQCLSEMGIGSCRTNDDLDIYIARFINMVVHECTHNSSVRGFITEYDRTNLLKCIKGVLTKCQNCQACDQNIKIVNDVITFCAESTMDTGLFLGKFKHLDDNSWEIMDGPWKDLTQSMNLNAIKKLPCRAKGDAMNTCMENLKKIKNGSNKSLSRLLTKERRKKNPRINRGSRINRGRM